MTSWLAARREQLGICLQLAVCFLTLCAGRTESAQLLKPGVVYSAPAMPADVRASYELTAEADQNYLLQIEQQGLDYIITVEDPRGDRRSYNSPLMRDERELVLIEEALEGRYLITIYSEEYTGTEGAHQIVIDSLGDSGDAKILQAWRLMSRGARANNDAGSEGWSAAIEAYGEAGLLWEQLGFSRERAQALFSVATIEYGEKYSWRTCLDLTLTVKALYRELGELALMASAAHLQAAALIEIANETANKNSAAVFDEALNLFRESADTHAALGNLYELAEVTNNIGLTYFYMGDYAKARVQWNDAAYMFQNQREWAGETKPVGNLAVIDYDQGYLSQAINTLEHLLQLLPEDRLISERARHLDSLGNTYRLHGNQDAALKSFTAALRLHRGVDDKGETWSLLGLGQTYYAIGNLDLAAEYLEQALLLAKAANEQRAYESIQLFKGNIAYLAGEFDAAFNLHELAYKGANSARSRIYLRQLMAEDLIAMKRYSEARLLINQSLFAAKEAGSPLIYADAQRALGWLNVMEGDSSAGELLLAESLSVYDSLKLEGKRATTLNLLARSSRSRGDLEQAARFGGQSMNAVENLRSTLIDPELRAFLLGAHRGYYEEQIATLMALHEARPGSTEKYLQQALSTSERARARMMGDLLSEASIRLRTGLPNTLLAKQEILTNALGDKRYQRAELLRRPEMSDVDTGSLRDLSSAMAEIETSLSILEADMRRTNPQYAQVASPETLSAEGIRQSLDTESVLLQYVLSKEASYVWAISSESIHAVRLAGSGNIEAAARAAYNALKRPPSSGSQERARRSLNDLAALVLHPVAQYLTGTRVIIAADGALQYIPFGVLPKYVGIAEPLLDSLEVVTISSVSTLNAQRKRPREQRPVKTLAVVADPVFNGEDPRLRKAKQIAGTQSPLPVSFAGTRSGSSMESLGRLSFTGREASAIADLVAPGQRVILRGFDANRQAVLGLPLHDYRYLHFATHGLIDSRYPSLSSLVLSLYEPEGHAQPGLLRMQDIYSLKLNAELVVLSACETALGREIRGEGLLGMAHGFIYAGADRLLLSLWQVPDRATADLMTSFYRYMLQEGMSAASALRHAQLDVAAQRRWKNPYFWGSFLLFGDWT